MSQRQRTGLLNVQIRTDEHQQVWQQAEQAVAETLGVDTSELSREEIARELAEAYRGGDACGGWREE